MQDSMKSTEDQRTPISMQSHCSSLELSRSEEIKSDIFASQNKSLTPQIFPSNRVSQYGSGSYEFSNANESQFESYQPTLFPEDDFNDSKNLYSEQRHLKQSPFQTVDSSSMIEDLAQPF